MAASFLASKLSLNYSVDREREGARMLDLFDQDRSSYVVFGYLQKNASEGRARVRICDSANDLACLLHHYGGGARTLIFTHTRYHSSS